MREAVRESLVQLFPTLRIDRQRFPERPQSRRRFVLCTRRVFESLADLFEDHEHVDSVSPWNVLVTEHESGFPFGVGVVGMALGYVVVAFFVAVVLNGAAAWFGVWDGDHPASAGAGGAAVFDLVPETATLLPGGESKVLHEGYELFIVIIFDLMLSVTVGLIFPRERL